MRRRRRRSTTRRKRRASIRHGRARRRSASRCARPRSSAAPHSAAAGNRGATRPARRAFSARCSMLPIALSSACAAASPSLHGSCAGTRRRQRWTVRRAVESSPFARRCALPRGVPPPLRRRPPAGAARGARCARQRPRCASMASSPPGSAASWCGRRRGALAAGAEAVADARPLRRPPPLDSVRGDDAGGGAAMGAGDGVAHKQGCLASARGARRCARARAASRPLARRRGLAPAAGGAGEGVAGDAGGGGAAAKRRPLLCARKGARGGAAAAARVGVVAGAARTARRPHCAGVGGARVAPGAAGVARVRPLCAICRTRAPERDEVEVLRARHAWSAPPRLPPLAKVCGAVARVPPQDGVAARDDLVRMHAQYLRRLGGRARGTHPHGAHHARQLQPGKASNALRGWANQTRRADWQRRTLACGVRFDFVKRCGGALLAWRTRHRLLAKVRRIARDFAGATRADVLRRIVRAWGAHVARRGAHAAALRCRRLVRRSAAARHFGAWRREYASTPTRMRTGGGGSSARRCRGGGATRRRTMRRSVRTPTGRAASAASAGGVRRRRRAAGGGRRRPPLPSRIGGGASARRGRVGDVE